MATFLLTPQARLWRPEERALISDFSQVDALAASPFNVYAATPHGLVTYDRRARRWRLPVTALDGYPSERVRVALADAAEDAVWLGTVRGWARYDAGLRAWERGMTPGAGGVLDLALDARDRASGVYVRTTRGWGFVPRGAGVALFDRPPPPVGQRIGPLDPETALAQAPAAEALRALILADPRLRGHRFTAAARSPDQEELFLGTSGLGVVRVDPGSGGWDRLEFGLIAPGAGAVAAGADGVWAVCAGRAGGAGGAGAARGERGVGRSGVTWVAADLSRTTSSEGAMGAAAGVEFIEGRDVLTRGGALWLATERGVFRLEGTANARRVLADAAWSLAPAPDGVWIGTANGLFLVTNDGQDRATRVADLALPVLSLLAVRESLWIGTPAGLRILRPGSAGPQVPAELAAQPSLAAPVAALARVGGDTLVAAVGDRLAWRGRGADWTLVAPPGELGRVVALAGDPDGGAWVGGTAGLARWRLAPSGGAFRILRAPGDLPAGARDLASDGDWLWVATDSGLVRLDRRAAALP